MSPVVTTDVLVPTTEHEEELCGIRVSGTRLRGYPTLIAHGTNKLIIQGCRVRDETALIFAAIFWILSHLYYAIVGSALRSRVLTNQQYITTTTQQEERLYCCY